MTRPQPALPPRVKIGHYIDGEGFVQTADQETLDQFTAPLRDGDPRWARALASVDDTAAAETVDAA